MRRTNAAESGSDRVALAKDAGMGRVSLFGVLAGTLVAYGAFLVLVSIVAAVANALDVTDEIATLNWEELGATSGLIVAGVLLLSYLFGGYVAGRMARRAGALNGFLVFVLGVLIVVGVSLLINLATDGDDISRNFRTAGIPTSGEEWGDAGTVAGIASLIAILIGPVLGGILGERWHAKLVRRALDPTVGREPGYQPPGGGRRHDVDGPTPGAQAPVFRPTPPARRGGYGRPAEEETRSQEEVPAPPVPPPPAEQPDEPRPTAWGAPPPRGSAESDHDGPRVTRRSRPPRAGR